MRDSWRVVCVTSGSLSRGPYPASIPTARTVCPSTFMTTLPSLVSKKGVKPPTRRSMCVPRVTRPSMCPSSPRSPPRTGQPSFPSTRSLWIYWTWNSWWGVRKLVVRVHVMGTDRTWFPGAKNAGMGFARIAPRFIVECVCPWTIQCLARKNSWSTFLCYRNNKSRVRNIRARHWTCTVWRTGNFVVRTVWRKNTDAVTELCPWWTRSSRAV